MNSFKKYAPKLRFKDITADFLEKYEKHMLDEGMSKSTIGIYCRSLRAIINKARYDKVIPFDMYPFGQKSRNLYEIPTAKNVKKALSDEEMAKFLSYDPKFTLDAFDINMVQFSMRANGMNMADIFRLRKENIIGDYLVFKREKTKGHKKDLEPIQVYITPELQAIMDKWGTHEENPKAFLFDVYDEGMSEYQMFNRKKDMIKEINDSLKRVRWKLGIESNFTTYTARHTWASAMNAHNVNILEISKGLGHTTIATTQNYLSDFNKEVKKEMGNVLSDVIKKVETTTNQSSRTNISKPKCKKLKM